MKAPTCVYKRINGKIEVRLVDKPDADRMKEKEGWTDSPAKVDDILEVTNYTVRYLAEENNKLIRRRKKKGAAE